MHKGPKNLRDFVLWRLIFPVNGVADATAGSRQANFSPVR
jgi:hypothetical protein